MFDGDPRFERLRQLREVEGYRGGVDESGNKKDVDTFVAEQRSGRMNGSGDPVCMHMTASLDSGCGGCGISFTEVSEQWEAWGVPAGHAPAGWQPGS
jgi:hypothetical protein